MHLFRVSEVKLNVPITIIAKENGEAAAIFLTAWEHAFGCVPDADFSIEQWRPKWTKDNKSLWRRLVNTGEKGIAWEGRNRWEFHDPYQDW